MDAWEYGFNNVADADCFALEIQDLDPEYRQRQNMVISTVHPSIAGPIWQKEMRWGYRGGYAARRISGAFADQ